PVLNECSRRVSAVQGESELRLSPRATRCADQGQTPNRTACAQVRKEPRQSRQASRWQAMSAGTCVVGDRLVAPLRTSPAHVSARYGVAPAAFEADAQQHWHTGRQ